MKTWQITVRLKDQTRISATASGNHVIDAFTNFRNRFGVDFADVIYHEIALAL